VADYPEDMRRRRRNLVLVVLGAGALAYLMHLRRLGGYELPVGWALLIGLFFFANRVLLCPACGRRLGSLNDKVCSKCGTVLTDEMILPPAPDGAVNPAARAYMERSELILARWGAIRKRLKKSPLVVGVLTMIYVAFFFHPEGMVPQPLKDLLFIGALAGLCAVGIWWLVLVHVVDAFFGIVFSLFRGRCPLCKAWFTHGSVVVPGAIITDFSLPDFCGSCGAKLR
jgi:hypothetical protein